MSNLPDGTDDQMIDDEGFVARVNGQHPDPYREESERVQQPKRANVFPQFRKENQK